MRASTWFARLLATAVVLATMTGCAGAPAESAPAGAGGVDEMPVLEAATLREGERLRVVATTSIVADVVANVGGDAIELTRLVPLGADPHAFQLTPQDVAAVSDAHVLFTNGAGLEEFLPDLLDATDGRVPTVPVSHGIALLQYHAGHDEDTHEDEDGHRHEGADPHTWLDPNNVVIWTRNVEQALAALDPANAAFYQANAERYRAELQALDAWIREQVAAIPEEHRKLVTDHTAFTYFAARYGFEQVGAVIPAYSTAAEPSPQELTALQDVLLDTGVPAIFVGTTANPRVAEQLSRDTGTLLVPLYTGSLSEADGPAATYLDMMRYNVSAMVEALAGK